MNSAKAPGSHGGGLSFRPHFTQGTGNPLKHVIWEERDIRVRDFATGEVVFAQDAFRVPQGWSQNAGQIVASKYAFGPEGKRERGVDDVVRRVVCAITKAGLAKGYFATGPDAMTFRDELTHLLIHQYAAFNSPVWFNVGIDHAHGLEGTGTVWYWDDREYDHDGSWDAGQEIHGRPVQTTKSYVHPQASACFIQGVEDNMESIMALATSEAMLFKHGSGSGTDLSKLRSTKERLSTGGKPSGPVSFMRIYDAVASVIKSGGKTRRAAKMQTLIDSHPDILEFIHAKGKEERKAKALIEAGYSDGMDGEAYRTVNFQNCNMSVRITDQFMRFLEAEDGGWLLLDVDREPVEMVRPEKIWDAIAQETWRCGDPGVQFTDTINSWHTCPNSGEITSSNPCSEYVFIDESACNLASLRLTKFHSPEGGFDVESFRHATRVMIVAMDILVDLGSYPTEAICRTQHEHRTLGLGYADLGGLLMSMGVPYDSDLGRQWAGAITSLMTGRSYEVSSEIAEYLGAFSRYRDNNNPMRSVVDRHFEHAKTLARSIPKTLNDGDLSDISSSAWQSWVVAVVHSERYGYRNAQVTLLAPTGTIGFMMDCTTTGIEPMIGLRATKQLAGGGNMTIVCDTVQSGLKAIGYSEIDIKESLAYIDEYGVFDHVSVFHCALAPHGRQAISYEGHLKMMAAVQPFLSGAISKTVNVPKEFTIQQIADTYKLAHSLGLKCCAIYRDQSKGGQPITVDAPKSSRCHKCGNPTLVMTGTCSTCPSCGEPQGGCS